MDNSQLAATLRRIALLLQMREENPFAIRAYQRAADVVDRLGIPVVRLAQEGKLRQLVGVGSKIAEQLAQLVESGTCTELARLREYIPEGVEDLTAVSGIGPKAAMALWENLQIRSLEQLREAAAAGRLAGLPRMSLRTQESILEGLQALSQRSDRVLLATAAEAADALVEALRSSGTCSRLTPAGSLRRGEPTVRDVDIVAASERPLEAMATFVALPEVVSVLGRGETKTSVQLRDGLQADLRIVPAECYGNLLQHFTGSKDHNVRLREEAVHHGWSVSEWGVAEAATGNVHRFTDEDDVYRLLGYDPIPPELRQGTDELARAAAHELPDLVVLEDIRGDLHMHTQFSDGKFTVREMAEAAVACGYEYAAICDHSAARPGGLSPDRLPGYFKELEAAQAALPKLRLLKGMEVDIRADASIDLPDEWLAQLDFVVASIHSAFKQEPAQIMARLFAACRHPAVRAIGHPTGRKLERRPGYPVDFPALFAEAARTGTWLEINAGPERLDLDGSRAREAQQAGCTLMVNSDAHRLEELAWMRWGVTTARRGWLRAEDVANTWPRKRFEAALAAGKQGAVPKG